MKDRLIELAERVEAATGPDRELDAEIAPLTELRVVDEGRPLGRCWYDKNGHGVPLPAFTASIDAATALVPEEWGWEVRSCGIARLLNPKPPGFGGGPCIQTRARTPALALTAASLRARAAMEDPRP